MRTSESNSAKRRLRSSRVIEVVRLGETAPRPEYQPLADGGTHSPKRPSYPCVQHPCARSSLSFPTRMLDKRISGRPNIAKTACFFPYGRRTLTLRLIGPARGRTV